jgi:hypothetical protein
LYLKNQSDRSMQDNRVGVGGPAILEGVRGKYRRKDRELQ